MPIYEFYCKKCDSEFEELVMGSDDGIKCPSCASKRVKKLMSVFAHKSGDAFVGSSGGSGCSGCTSGNCSCCH